MIRPRPYDHPDAQVLIALVQQLYQRLYGGHDRDRTDPAQFAPPDGLFLVGYLDDAPVACGGWRMRPDRSAEIKRMYVAESARATGLGRHLLAELETTAASAGAERMVLNTGYRQLDAIALYESSGYARTDDRFGHYAAIEGAHFYAKSLDS